MKTSFFRHWNLFKLFPLALYYGGDIEDEDGPGGEMLDQSSAWGGPDHPSDAEDGPGGEMFDQSSAWDGPDHTAGQTIDATETEPSVGGTDPEFEDAMQTIIGSGVGRYGLIVSMNPPQGVTAEAHQKNMDTMNVGLGEEVDRTGSKYYQENRPMKTLKDVGKWAVRTAISPSINSIKTVVNEVMAYEKTKKDTVEDLVNRGYDPKEVETAVEEYFNEMRAESLQNALGPEREMRELGSDQKNDFDLVDKYTPPEEDEEEPTTPTALENPFFSMGIALDPPSGLYILGRRKQRPRMSF